MSSLFILCLQVLVFFVICVSSRPECSAGSCEDCVGFDCFWCETSELSYCTAEPHLCSTGLLHEDTLFCPLPRTESFRSLEWWGENAFFSRAAGCSQISGNNCQACLTQPNLSCGFCQQGHKCMELSLSSKCALDVACALDPNPSSETDEDQDASLWVDPLILIPGEKNDTESGTSTKMKVSVVSNNADACPAVFDSISNTVTVKPKPDWNGVCKMTIKATTIVPTLAHYTLVTIIWTLTVRPIEDAPVKKSSFDSEAEKLKSLKQGTTITLDGCQMFLDVDQENFVVQFEGDALNFVQLSYQHCTCYTGDKQCRIQAHSTSWGVGKVTFTADDGKEKSVGVQVDLSIDPINNPPTYTSLASNGRVSFTVLENTPNTSFDFTPIFQDQDGDNLELQVGNEIFNLVSSASFDGMKLKMELDGLKNGTVSTTVSAFDGHGGMTSVTFVFSITPVNDPIVILEQDFNGRWFEGNSGTNTTIDLGKVISDEESNFADGSLSCLASTAAGGEAVLGISRNILTINYVRQTSGIPFTITCRDYPLSFPIELRIYVVVNFVNHPPKVSQNFPFLIGDTPLSGSSVVSPQLALSNFFTDIDGQPLTYQTISDLGAVKANITSGVITISLMPSAKGNYTFLVTATDPVGESVGQTLQVFAYMSPRCSQPAPYQWDPATPLTIDLGLICDGSGNLTVSWSESSSSNIPLGKISYSINGEKITFSSSDPCLSGTYNGLAHISDEKSNFTIASIQISVGYGGSSISSLEPEFEILVKSSPSEKEDGYDRSITVVNSKATINMVGLLRQCASNGLIDFFSSGQTWQFLWGVTGTDTLVSKIDQGKFIIYGGNRAASILRNWSYNATITMQDRKTTDTASFKLYVYKPNLSL